MFPLRHQFVSRFAAAGRISFLSRQTSAAARLQAPPDVYVCMCVCMCVYVCM